MTQEEHAGVSGALEKIIRGLEDTRELLLAAVLQERERCAKVVESWPEPSYEFDRGDLDAIARRIREGSP